MASALKRSAPRTLPSQSRPRDLNPRPLPYQGSALPTELGRRRKNAKHRRAAQRGQTTIGHAAADIEWRPLRARRSHEVPVRYPHSPRKAGRRRERSLAGQEIPEHVRAFLSLHIDSVVQLELLLYLYKTRGQRWDANALAKELRIDPAWTRGQLEHLCGRKLLACEGPTYQ